MLRLCVYYKQLLTIKERKKLNTHESARAARDTLEREAGRIIGDSGAPMRAGEAEPRAYWGGARMRPCSKCVGDLRFLGSRP